MPKQTANDLRQIITRQMDNLDTAIELSEMAAKVDIASSESDPFPIVSLNDVLTFIAELRNSKRLDDEVVYMLARFPTNELQERKLSLSLKNKEISHSRPVFDAKQPWQEHVKRCLRDGVEMQSIRDIKDHAGVDEQPWQEIPDSTLKRWVKEVNPTIQFKAGRPSSKK